MQGNKKRVSKGQLQMLVQAEKVQQTVHTKTIDETPSQRSTQEILQNLQGLHQLVVSKS